MTIRKDSQQNMEELDFPEGWIMTSIGNVVDLNPPKPPRDALYPEALVTFVPMTAVDAYYGKIACPTERTFGSVRKGYTAFQENDVIFAKITPCMENGKSAIVPALTNGLGFGSTEFHVLRSNGAVVPDYLFYYLRQESFRKAAEAEMTGSVGQKRVPSNFLKNSSMPLPPVPEQKRIVAKVEELLERVNAVCERLARVKEILKRFRQSVLSAACYGRLTADWRVKNPSEGTADEILREILLQKNNFAKQVNIRKSNIDVAIENEPYEVPETWKWACLGDFAKYVTSGSRDWSKYYSEEGAYFVRSGEIKTNELKLEDSIRVKLPEKVEGKRALIERGDILTTITGANVGKCALVKQEIPEAYVSQSVALTKILDHKLSEYLYLSLLSPIAGGRDLNEMAYGVGRPVLSLPQISKIRIPLPPLKEQCEIVRRVKALLNLADEIEKRVLAADERAERLTQAILAKAFRGELVPTEAELAQKEGRSYESADILLYRNKINT